MGQHQSTLQRDEINYFKSHTPCKKELECVEFSRFLIVSEKEIKKIYSRFQQLDKYSVGIVVPEDLLSIPELTMNPLSNLYLRFLFKLTNLQSDMIKEFKQPKGLDFEAFLDALSVFHVRTSLEVKFKCKQREYVIGKVLSMAFVDLFEFLRDEKNAYPLNLQILLE